MLATQLPGGFFVPVNQLDAVNIWIFNPFDALPWEGKAQRYASLANSLAVRGHSVVHWSSGFSHTFKTRRQVPAGFDAAALPYAIELIDCPGYRSNVSLSRVLNHQAYGRGLVREGLSAVDGGRRAAPDLILASMPPVEGPGAARKLKQHFGCKLVVDVMDAWPDTLLQVLRGTGGGEPGGRRQAGLLTVGRLALAPYYRQLRRALQCADGVCAQSQAFADFAQAQGATDRVDVFYLGAEAAPAELEPRSFQLPAGGAGGGSTEPGADPAKTGAPRTAARPLAQLLYLGAMGRSYDLETLFEAVAQLNRESLVVALDVVGEGEKRAALESRQVPGVSFTGYLSGDALAGRMRSADLGIVPFLPGSGVALPYKAAEYLAHGLPVISSIDGELGEHVRHYGCGSTYTPLQVDELATVLLSYATDRARIAREADAARNCFRERFNRDQIYPAFAEWVEAVASGGRGQDG